MKKYFLSAIAFFTAAQNAPLNGSEKLITKKFSFTDFDKVEFNDLDGKVEVNIGASYSIDITIDDNLENLLCVTNDDHILTVSLRHNHQNRLYIEHTSIIIKISLPAIFSIKQNGNNSLEVTNINSRTLKLKSSGNGSVNLNGTIDGLTIMSSGNCNVNAQMLPAKNVQVTKRGNGNVTINTDYTFTANGSGNGGVINTGKGIADNGSYISGNAAIQYPHQKSVADTLLHPIIKTKMITVTLKNTSASKASLLIKYAGGGSYGINVPAKDTVISSFPAGTKIYNSANFRPFSKSLLVITEENDGKIFIVK